MRVPLPPAAWPYGPARPGVATAAAWLGRATAVGTALVALMVTLAGGPASWTAVPAGLAAAALLVGARRLLAGRGRALLMAAGTVTAAALVAAAVLDAEPRSDGTAGVFAFLVLVLPSPVLTVVLAGLPRVGGWLTGAAPGGLLPNAPPPAAWPPELWPYGPPRPASATAAAVLALVAGALTVVVTVLAQEPRDPFTAVLLAGLLCVPGFVAGALTLLRRRSRWLLVASGTAAVLVLLAAAVVAGATAGPDLPGALIFVALALALPLPATSLGLALRRDVGSWLATGRGTR